MTRGALIKKFLHMQRVLNTHGIPTDRWRAYLNPEDGREIDLEDVYSPILGTLYLKVYWDTDPNVARGCVFLKTLTTTSYGEVEE